MLFEHIISIIAPHKCLACGKEGALACTPCVAALPLSIARCCLCQQPTAAGVTCPTCRTQTPITQTLAVTPYTGLAKDLVWQLKAQRARAAARILGAACARHLRGTLNHPTVITYVPTAPIRARQRGYDQARLIARYVAQYSGLPMLPLLARTSGVRQVGASAVRRRQQMADAFRPIQTYAIPTQRILLIDDVITTGASLNAASHALHAAGAASITALVFAQA